VRTSSVRNISTVRGKLRGQGELEQPLGKKVEKKAGERKSEKESRRKIVENNIERKVNTNGVGRSRKKEGVMMVWSAKTPGSE
jgi:hypothetical protein